MNPPPPPARLLALTLLAPGLAFANPGLVPYPIDWAHAAQSAVDLSRFLEAPAGRDGFLRVQGEHLVKPDGTRFRFWGVNLCGPDCFPSHDEADLLAGDLARLGVNVVRFHHLDSNWGRSIFDTRRDDTRQLDAENLDRLDYLIAQLKRWGIYANLNLNVLRKFKAGDGVRDWERLGIGKGATYFNPRLIELQHEYARQLLTHSNAYTGREYRHEPAVAVVEMVNENSLLEAWVGSRLVGRDDKAGDTWSPLPISYAEELTDRYNRWLESHRPPRVLDALRTETKVGPRGRVPRLRPDQFAAATRDRFHAEAQFYMELEHAYFAGMRNLLQRDLGVPSMLVGTADHNDGYSAYAHVRANLLFDIVDGHGYWEHPRLGGETWIRNTPMVNDPLDSTVVQFARTPVVGRPFTISEVNHPFPHEYAGEGFPILTAYALFHDWDGIYWFTWGRGRRGDPAAGIQKNGWFDFSNDPVKYATLHACALAWHRRDLLAARRTVVRAYTEEHLTETLRADRNAARPFFTPGFARSTPLQHATRFTLDPRASSDRFPAAAPLDHITTDTGQIRWLGAAQKQGQVVIESPRTQAVIGFQNARTRTSHLGPEVTNAFATVLLTTLDDATLGRSRRLLLVVTARTSNTGFRWKDDRQTVAEWGAGPVLVEPVAGRVLLRQLESAEGLLATPLGANGCPLARPSPLAREGEHWVVPLGNPAALWWVLEVQRPDRGSRAARR